MREILTELYQLSFMCAILYILNTVFTLALKAYGYFKLNRDNITYTLTTTQKIVLWVSISIFLSYLIK